MNRFGIKEEELCSLKNLFASTAEVEKVILFGSRAKGNYKPYSDLDIVLCGEDVSSTVLGNLFMDIDDLLMPYKIDLLLYNRITNEALKHEIETFGVVIYQKNK
ncbi:MAG: nucleotidyltransferase domain-containing protein [Tannerellaceae bacterium]